jgi:hypothetical protein
MSTSWFYPRLPHHSFDALRAPANKIPSEFPHQVLIWWVLPIITLFLRNVKMGDEASWCYPRRISSLVWCLQAASRHQSSFLIIADKYFPSSPHCFYTAWIIMGDEASWCYPRRISPLVWYLTYQDINRVSSSGLNLMSTSHNYTVFTQCKNGRWGFLVLPKTYLITLLTLDDAHPDQGRSQLDMLASLKQAVTPAPVEHMCSDCSLDRE